jgi:hypothetical protein
LSVIIMLRKGFTRRAEAGSMLAFFNSGITTVK